MTQEQVYIRADVKQGKGGRYRVYLRYEDGEHIGVFPIRGFDTRGKAWALAITLSESKWLFGVGVADGEHIEVETDEEETGFLADVRGWLGL